MTRTFLALALAEESKPVVIQVGDALRPAAEAYGKPVNTLVNEFFAGSKGSMGEAARANLKIRDLQECEANRRVCHTMKKCISLETSLMMT